MIVRIFRSWGALAARLFLFGEFGLELGDFGLERRDFGIPGLAAAGAWMGWTALLPIIILAALSGAIVGIIMLRARGQDRSVPFAFGPFLAIAMWIWLIAGDPILAAYMRLSGLR